MTRKLILMLFYSKINFILQLILLCKLDTDWLIYTKSDWLYHENNKSTDIQLPLEGSTLIFDTISKISIKIITLIIIMNLLRQQKHASPIMLYDDFMLKQCLLGTL